MTKNICCFCGFKVEEGDDNYVDPASTHASKHLDVHRNFKVGDMIANGGDPSMKDFFCGSITSFAADGFWVTMPGHAGTMRIAHRNATDLVPVLIEHDHVEIIADGRYIDHNIKQFVGGVVNQERSSDEQYCVNVLSGYVYIPRTCAIGAMDAVRMIHGPCPQKCA